VHAPFIRGSLLPVPNSQSAAVAHGRPSESHSLRSLPAHDALAQSSSVPHASPGCPRWRPALHTLGPFVHEAVQLVHDVPHDEHRPEMHCPDAHSSATLQRSPSSFDAGAMQALDASRTGEVGS
jgi:hypothetical protein